MILYHGSLAQIPSPEIRKRSHTLDYGEGFYTTSSYDQAKAWVKRKLQNSSQPLGYINKYELNTAALDSLKCLHFKDRKLPLIRWEHKALYDKLKFTDEC